MLVSKTSKNMALKFLGTFPWFARGFLRPSRSKFSSCRMIVGRKPRANLKLMPSDTQKKSMKCLATGAVTSLDFALVNCSMNHCQRRLMSTRSDSSDDEEDEINRELEEIEKWLADPEYQEVFEEHYLLPSSGHRVFILQPDYKRGGKRFSSTSTSAQLQLKESVALIDSLHRWTVADTGVYSVKNSHKFRVWGKGNFQEITDRLAETPGVTAVVVNMNMLSGLQLAELQKAWRLPVYDRYTLVLQIFQTRARTKVAKLQVALAEIPYLRSRLRGTHTGDLGNQTVGFAVKGGISYDDRKELLQNRELKLKKTIAKVEGQRAVEKKERKRREIPTVAVVGYTNAGKTSLIKALTGDQGISPRNQLFATLDVTVHGGKLLNHMPVLYVDTVGFISNIPTDLIASFSATLNDMLDADAIIVVNDVSHPDYEWQHETVHQTLKSLSLPPRLSDNIIEIDNKVDLMERNTRKLREGVLQVSSTQGTGLGLLQQKIKEVLLESTGRMQKKLRIPLQGQHLSWLYKEATVEGTHTLEDPESILVDVVITPSSYARFKQQFGKPKLKKKLK